MKYGQVKILELKMISKKQLKKRLIDICNGAGYVWDENHEFFETHEDSLLDSVGKAIQAIERAFGFPSCGLESTTRLRVPWRLSDYEDIDTMVDLVHEAIEYDL